MSDSSNSALRRICHTFGSMWFAAVILMLLLVGMASATAGESMKSTEWAKHHFYDAWWFEGLLWLLAVNVLFSILARLPLANRQIGFVITHVGILVILAGALVTKHLGVDGQLGIREGQTMSQFLDRADVIRFIHPDTKKERNVLLTPSSIGGLAPIDNLTMAPISMGGVKVTLLKYAPDSDFVQEVLNDNRTEHKAVEVVLRDAQGDASAWVFAHGPTTIGRQRVAYRVAKDPVEFDRLLTQEAADDVDQTKIVRIEFETAVYELPLNRCLKEAVPVGKTGYSVHVLRYLPHATVGNDGKLKNVSPQPTNPAIELELIGPDGTQQRKAFAKFPDFSSMHGGSDAAKDLKITFLVPTPKVNRTPIEIIEGSDGELHVRLALAGSKVVSQKLNIGEAVNLPQAEATLTLARRFDHARQAQTVQPREDVRDKRVPAVLVSFASGEVRFEQWLQKYQGQRVVVGQQFVELLYGEKEAELGFNIRLDKFKVGRYPGTSRPRSFESHITLIDPDTGSVQSRVVSMNNPTQFGGYTLYQSSYRQDGDAWISFLSVSHDPGRAIVFAGYIMLLLGMVVVLCIRMADRQAVDKAAAALDERGESATRSGSASGNGSRAKGSVRNKMGSKVGAQVATAE